MREQAGERPVDKTSDKAVRPALTYQMTDIRYRAGASDWQLDGGGDHMMLVVTGGEGRIVIDGAGFKLERGKCFIAAPDMTGSVLPGRDGLTLYELDFELRRNAESHLPSSGVSPANDRFPILGEAACAPFSQCIERVESIYANRHAGDGLEPFYNHVRFLELLRFIFQQNGSAAAGGKSLRQQVESSIEQVRRHYSEPWTVERLAAAADVPRGQYTRMFKAITGQIPLDYLKGIRLDRAKQLLLMTDDRLFEIAQHVGYANEYYFGRRFKQSVGISPGQYRRNHRDNVRVVAPFLEDFLLALGITPVVQCSHAGWGKQDYLGLDEVPVFDFTADSLEALSRHRPDLIMMDGGIDRWIAFDQFNRLAPTYHVPHRGEDWRSMLRTMAELFGKTEAARSVIAAYEDKASAARALLSRPLRGQTVACLRISAAEICLYAGPEHGYTGPVLYGDLGLRPHPLVLQMTGHARRVSLTREWLARLDADHLFVAFDKSESAVEGEERERLQDDPVWRALPAVRNRRVYEVDFFSWMNYGVISHGRKIDDVLRVLA